MLQNQNHTQLEALPPRTPPPTDHIATPVAVLLHASPPRQSADTPEAVPPRAFLPVESISTSKAVLLHAPPPTEPAAITGTSSAALYSTMTLATTDASTHYDCHAASPLSPTTSERDQMVAPQVVGGTSELPYPPSVLLSVVPHRNRRIYPFRELRNG